ncbi:MAG: hypothetical protein ABWZ89_01440 [Acidimicrobiales bacterium]
MLAQLRRDLRTQWRSLLALAVLVGLIGGVVLASTMAARRTASAYTRYVDFAHAEDINIGAPGINDPTFAAAVSAIESYPEVAAVGPMSSQELLSTEEGLEFFALGGVDDRVGTTINPRRSSREGTPIPRRRPRSPSTGPWPTPWTSSPAIRSRSTGSAEGTPRPARTGTSPSRTDAGRSSP